MSSLCKTVFNMSAVFLLRLAARCTSWKHLAQRYINNIAKPVRRRERFKSVPLEFTAHNAAGVVAFFVAALVAFQYSHVVILVINIPLDFDGSGRIANQLQR